MSETTIEPPKVILRDDTLDQKLANWIGLLLRICVIISGSIVLFGILLWAIQNDGPNSVDAAMGKTGTLPKVNPSTILEGLRDFTASAYIQLGLLVLILTPTLRVFVTAIVFVMQRAWILVLCSALVLTILVLGLFGIVGG
jgi:uncharacterized membrane protein